MRKFGVKAPNHDRVVYHEAETLEAERAALLKAGFGYVVDHEVVNGVSVTPLPDGLKHYSFMTSLLQAHADELREWLADNGCVCRCGGSARREGAKHGKADSHEAQD